MSFDNSSKGSQWQQEIWDERSQVYREEIGKRFAPIIKHLLSLCDSPPYERVMDLGCGTGAVAVAAAKLFGAGCNITAVDISPKMIEQAKLRFSELELKNIKCLKGSAEEIPVEEISQDLILASLSFMYVIDRTAASKEISRTLAPGGKFIAVVWGEAEETDIVKFQEIAGSFAPTPPVKGVGPGSLGNPKSFLTMLRSQGLTVEVKSINTVFEVNNFDSAWETLAGVTSRGMDDNIVEQAKMTARKEMWPSGDSARTFNNRTQYIIATKP